MVYDPRQDPRYNKDKLYMSLLKRESNFNPNAVSPTGARGYAQLLRSTASDPGFGIAPNPAAIHDPEQNVAFGKSYLDAMMKRYGNDKAAALVAYNGGPGAADKWVANGKNDKVISAESRNYYKTILKDAGAGYDFSKIKPTLPKDVPSTDDEEEETDKTVGFSKLRIPGKKNAAKSSEDSTDESEESDTETEDQTKEVAKVSKTKASKEADDEDDDEEDDDEGSSGSKSKGGRKIAGGALELKEFTPGPMFKPVPIQLGIPKLQLAAVETLDDPRDR